MTYDAPSNGYEAIAMTRKNGQGPTYEKWMTVKTNDPAAAREAFRALGWHVVRLRFQVNG